MASTLSRSARGFTPRADLPKLGVAALLCTAAAALGGFATTPNIAGWYEALAKPPLTPPNWAFPTAWTVLFTMMAASLFLVWRRPPSAERGRAIFWFLVQLVCNVSWSFAFFAFHSPFAGLVVVTAMLASIGMAIATADRVDRLAALLLVPYLLWVSFAAYLNLGLFVLNS